MHAATRSSKCTWLRFGGAAVLSLALGATVVGCGSSDSSNADSAATTTAPSTAPGAVNGAVTTAPQSSGGQQGGGNNGAQPTQAPAGPAPVIVSFSTPEDIDCHNGNSQNFTAEWTTQNAASTTISIDGPGVYKSYGPNDSDSLPFNCSSAHSFLLTAIGADGRTATKSITLQPRNVQTENAEPEDE